MLVDIIIYVFATLISWTASILPTWTLWPPIVLESVAFFGQQMQKLNFFIFDVPAIMVIVVFLLYFEIYYFTTRKIVSLINFFRGSGKLEL